MKRVAGPSVIAACLVATVAATTPLQTPALEPRDEPVTYADDVAPLLYAHCTTCHRRDGPAPFSLVTFADARRRATQIAEVTRSRYMPRWKPEPGIGSFIGERRLGDEQIDLLDRWAKAGAPEGDPARTPRPPAAAPGWQLGAPDLVVHLPEYTLRADGRDVFRNFVVPVPVSATRFVRGLELRPGSPALHHANIRLDYTGASRRLDEADPASGYEGIILRSAEYPDGHFLGWTPGQFAPLAPRGLAWRLDPGADFVVQFHMRPTGKAERMRAAIGLYFTDDAPTEIPAMLRLGRQNIQIRAGDPDYRSIDEYTLPVDVRVEAIQPHSHYRATRVHASALLPDGTTRPLVSIPRWDFAWQDVYRLAAPFWLPAGTRIRTEYAFDNSAANPRNPESPPKPVVWGFRSSDEMADVWIQVMTRSDADRLRLVHDFRRKAAAEDLVGYETQLRVNPANAALHDDVASIYLEIGKPDEAARHFAATARLHPESAPAHDNLGNAHESAGRLAEAEEHYRTAIALDPAYAPARVNLGNVMIAQGRAADAIAEYRHAIRLEPGNADARNNLGRVLSAQGHQREAIEQLEEAVRLRPAHAAAHFNLAGTLLQSGDAPRAIAHYREATKIRPDWAPSLTALAWVLSSHPDGAVRDPEEAVRLATRAADLGMRQDHLSLDALAAACAAAGRFGEAVSNAMLAADVARRAGAREQAAHIENRLALYRRGRAYVAGRR